MKSISPGEVSLARKLASEARAYGNLMEQSGRLWFTVHFFIGIFQPCKPLQPMQSLNSLTLVSSYFFSISGLSDLLFDLSGNVFFNKFIHFSFINCKFIQFQSQNPDRSNNNAAVSINYGNICNTWCNAQAWSILIKAGHLNSEPLSCSIRRFFIGRNI